ncbi:MAG: CoA pyrophosphatase [Burkholderiales bacterium]|nr:CoA pyrophosphatase [Burkholderiales bacterium]
MPATPDDPHRPTSAPTRIGRRIIDPLAVPVAGTDAHLPALGADRLGEPALRARFDAQRQGAVWTPEFSGDGRFIVQGAPSPAAVLVPLVRRDAGLSVMLTRRTAHLRDHAGQISFPGGRSEPADGSPIATALRETEEEVGLERRHIEVVGQLPHYLTITGYDVTPVVALVSTPFALHPDGSEVAEVFEVPLTFLMTPAHHQRHEFTWEGGPRRFLSMPWHGRGEDGREREYFIWGATAAMLRNLYGFLAA